MSTESYWRAIALLIENGLDPLPVKRPTAEKIRDLEERLNVKLSRSYRYMLNDFGILQVESIDISGIGNYGA